MTTEVNFTDAWLRKLKASAKREDFRDKGTRGLQLRSSPSGTKTFSFVFRLGSRMGRATIGKYPENELRFARSKADEFRKLVAQGIDPRIEKRTKRSEGEMTLESMVHEFIEEYAKKKTKSWKQAESNLRLYLISKHATVPISTITRNHIKTILKELNNQGKKVTANRALAHMSKFFNWLVAEEYLQYSPADKIEKEYEELEREHVLRDAEIKAIWMAATSLSRPYNAWIKLLLLCGQRRGETASIRRSQIVDGCWHLSGSDTKNGRPNIIPLSRQAQAIVDLLLEQNGNYLIKTDRIGDKPINGFSKVKRQIDKLSGVTGWRMHDVRRTVSTNLTKLGVDRFILQKILNHTETGATKIYDRYSYMDEKREALQKWADKLDEIIRR